MEDKLSDEAKIQILQNLDWEKMWELALSEPEFFISIIDSSELHNLMVLVLNSTNIQEMANPSLRPILSIKFKKACIKNWRFSLQNEIILEHLINYHSCIKHIIFKNCRFVNSGNLLNILQILDNIDTLEFEDCFINHIRGRHILQFPNLKSISFSSCNENLYIFFQNQLSVSKITVISYINSWNGFPHEDFTILANSLQNLKHIEFKGEGTASYFDKQDFPYRIHKLEADFITFNWYIGIEIPRMTFLISQLESLQELRIKNLPNDFDGGLILKFIIERMKLKTFYYGNIPLIINEQKQNVREFSSSETQIEATLEMFRQFHGIQKFNITMKDDNPAVEEIERRIMESGRIFHSFICFEVVKKFNNGKNIARQPKIHTKFMKKFQDVKINSFKKVQNIIKIFIDSDELCKVVEYKKSVRENEKKLSSSPNDSIKSLQSDHKKIVDLLSTGHIPVNQKYVTNFEKGIEISQQNVKILKFSSEWEKNEIFDEIRAHNIFKNKSLFMIVIEVKDIQSFVQTEESDQEKDFQASKNKCQKNILNFLAEYVQDQTFIIQLISRSEYVTKIYYKDENIEIFEPFLSHRVKPVRKIKNFQTFLWLFMNKQFTNFEETMIDLLPNVKNLNLIWNFLNTLDLKEDFYSRVIIKCAAKGSTHQLFTVLNDKVKSTNMSLNIDGMENLTKIFKLKTSICGVKLSHMEESILLAAVENSNSEVIKYLTEKCCHIIQRLPFSHQIDLSTVAYEIHNVELLCDLVEFCDFPFPKDFDATSVVHKRLKIIINDRQEFHEAVKNEKFDIIDSLISKFSGNKLIYSTKNMSALYKAITIRNLNTYYHLKVTYGLEISQDEEKYIKAEFHPNKMIPANANAQISVPSDNNVTASLIAKTSIYLTKQNRNNYKIFYNKIKNWYQQIYNMKFGSALLNVVSSCEKLRIVFDFNNEYTNQMDNIVHRDNDTSRICYQPINWVFIGANEIQGERKIRETIAHEFCHYAAYTVFKNRGKPYYKSKNKEVKQIYQNIIRRLHKQLIQERKFENIVPIDHCNNFILQALNYHDEVTDDSIPFAVEQELIVCVVAMLAYYHEDEGEIRDLEKIYALLFQFYAEHVNPDFEKFDFKMQCVVAEFNERTGTVKKVLKDIFDANKNCIQICASKNLNSLLSTNISIVVTNILKLFINDFCSNVYHKGLKIFSKENIIMNAEQLTDENIVNELTQIFSINKELTILIDCSKTNVFEKGWIFKMDKNHRIIFIISNQNDAKNLVEELKFENVNELNLNYNWNDITSESKLSLLETKINFQNKFENSILDLHGCVVCPKGYTANCSQKDMILTTESDLLSPKLLKMLVEKIDVNVNASFLKTAEEFRFLFIERSFVRITRSGDYQFESSDKLSLNELIDKTKDDRFVIIEGNAGTGKTWALKSLAYKISEEFLRTWVTYVDLKQFINAFHEERFEEEYKSVNVFTKFMIKYVIKSEESIEIEIFKGMYKNGKVIIFFDGFDEIFPRYTQFVTQLLQSFEYNGGNQLWISTRSFARKLLQENLNIDESFKLYDLKNEDGVELISRAWALNDLRQEKCEIKSKEDFLIKFNKLNDEKFYKSKASLLLKKTILQNSQSVNSALLCKMLAEVGNEIKDSIEKFSIYKVFDKFVHKQSKKLTHEKNQATPETCRNIQNQDSNLFRFHKAQAMIYLFPEFSNLCDMQLESNNLSDKELIKCGFVIENDGIKLFVHQTFAEFFVADFSIDVLRKILEENVQKASYEFITEILMNEKYEIIQTFFNDALEYHNILNDIEESLKNKNKNLSEFSKHLNIFDVYNENFSRLQMFLNIKVFINLILKDVNHKDLLEMLFGEIQIRIENFLAEKKSENQENSKYLIEIAEMLIKAAKSSFEAITLENLINRIEGTYGKRIIKTILNQKLNDKCFPNVFQKILMSLRHDAVKIPNYINIYKNYFTFDEIVQLMKELSFDSENILLRCMERKDFEYLLPIWKNFEIFFETQDNSQQFRELVIKTSFKKDTILHYYAKYCYRKEYHNILWRLLLKTFRNHQNELWNFMIQVNENGRTFISYLIDENIPDVITFIFGTIYDTFGREKMLEIFGCRQNDESYILSYAACDPTHENFECMINLIDEMYESQFDKISVELQKKNNS